MSKTLSFLINVDTNDADYVTNVINISEETYAKFLPFIQSINNFMPYIGKYGVCSNNFPYGECYRPDCGEKSIYEIYCQYDESYIDEFIETFIKGDFEYGFHTIESITPIVLSEPILNCTYEIMKKRIDESEDIQTYYKKQQEYMSYKRKSDGKSLNSIPFDEMTPEELQMIREYRVLWKQFRPDIE